MDINTLRGFSSVLVLLAFIGVCWWAFSPKRKKKFEEAANLPFADEPPADRRKDSAPEQRGAEANGDSKTQESASDKHKQG